MSQHAIENARAWADTIHLYALGLDQDNWDRLEELREDPAEDPEELAELERMAAEFPDCTDADEIRDHAQESALSVELSGTWTPGATPEADSYIILLSTGGPALRIVGDLGQYGCPSSATMQWQDWGEPWTDIREAEEDDLLAFVSCFYLGE
jgi:hypothetical protein